jgi:NAD(P)-dependent dehydrogenase (short-subunit alcohol dehydrogenase family)
MSAEQYSPPNEAPKRKIYEVLKGQKALVTGASKGLGAGIAAALAEAGCDVLVNYASDRKGAEETAAVVEKFGRKAHIFKADVSKEEEVLAMFGEMSGFSAESISLSIIQEFRSMRPSMK